ncbi:MAG: patatin-like phospholipase family protein [Spirochaetales bacterium]|nr:patatin-like phospholipase family protein [Spirochaetales bacterium]
MHQSGYALVLSGGGAKGIYHIGVWKALREIGVTIDAVIGNSVGALIAGFIAQGDFNNAEKALDDIDIRRFIEIPEEFVKDGRIVIDRKSMKKLDRVRESVIKNKGIDTTPLKVFLNKYLDEGKIRKRGLDLGIITFNLDDFRPVEVFLDQMEEGSLFDYLLASATFPGFKTTKIRKKHFIDGGVYNNIPYSMAKERGYRKIIVVDISGIGFVKKPDITGTQTVSIRNSIQLGGVFDFSRDFFQRFKLLGYLDTMKTFEKIGGIRYFYRDNPGLCRTLASRLESENAVNGFFNDDKWSGDGGPDTNEARIREVLPKEYRHYRQIVHSLAECAALSLNLDRIKERSFGEFVDEIRRGYRDVETEISDLRKRFDKKDIRELVEEIIDVAKHTDIDTFSSASVYKYDRILESILRPRGGKVPFSSLSGFFPFLKGARIFFRLVDGEK